MLATVRPPQTLCHKILATYFLITGGIMGNAGRKVMSRSLPLLFLGVVCLSFSGFAGAQVANKKPPAAKKPPAVKKSLAFIVTTPVVELRAGSNIMMYGTGFQPKQEVTVLFKDAGGGMSGISSSLKPEPVPNEEGAGAAAWDISSYTAVFKPGTGMLTVVDKNWKTIGEAPVVLVAPPPKPKPEAAKPDAPKPEAAKPAAAKPEANAKPAP
jgi:hypothetical protein